MNVPINSKVRQERTDSVRVLEGFLGARWQPKLLLLSVLVFWPAIWFGLLRRAVVLDAARFTEEWLKTGIAGVLLYACLQILEEKRRRAERHDWLETNLTRDVRTPATNLIALLTPLLSPSTEAWSLFIGEKPRVNWYLMCLQAGVAQIGQLARNDATTADHVIDPARLLRCWNILQELLASNEFRMPHDSELLDAIATLTLLADETFLPGHE